MIIKVLMVWKTYLKEKIILRYLLEKIMSLTVVEPTCFYHINEQKRKTFVLPGPCKSLDLFFLCMFYVHNWEESKRKENENPLNKNSE